MTLYDWYFTDNLLSKQECKNIIDICLNNKSNQIVDRHGSTKRVKTYVTDLEHLKQETSKLFSFLRFVNQTYFGFNIFPDGPHSVNLNVYSNDNNEYPYHRDGSIPGSMCDTKLTVILNLSQEEYSGGDFYMFLGKDIKIKEINRTGSVLIFPSFLYHKVSPVTKGERTTLSAWIEGPNFC